MLLTLIAIGVPGSGKTTLLAPLARRRRLVRISRDDIRQEWFDHPHDQRKQDEVHEEANRRMHTVLGGEKSVLLDSTFCTKAGRKEVCAEARAAGAERVVGVIFSPTLEEALERNRSRDHVVKDEVVEKLYAELVKEPPHLNEGFDALYTIENLAELEAKEFKS